MIDMSKTTAPKSDQMNADDLIGKTMTIKISDVKLTTGDQPASLHFEGDNGKPYKPCKSMRRVLVAVWGPDAKQYIGRSLTLFRDDKVAFGGVAVGGIRISHMSHIEGEFTMPLTVSRAQRKPYKVKPLVVSGNISKATDNPLKATAQAINEKIKSANDMASLDAILAEHNGDIAKIKTASKTAYDAIMQKINERETQIGNSENAGETCETCGGDEMIDDGFGNNIDCPNCKQALAAE